ncbi:PilZ domain-containing protein [Humisphaera borealis]|uniref:PilZ domain-containing protein n=1 Tax=Humisphaera borealis TaxID=2807512 RepID=A0A7M2X1F9_9BACT|nr:PilZ domain-containing protein [Humisphaera borealis]QOV91504.1 PilZ domain-containing protein [Humisphaera borealis]
MRPTDPQWMMPEGSVNTMRLVVDEPDTTGPDTAAGDGNDMTPMTIHFERRTHRRFDVEPMSITIERWDGRRDSRLVFGQIIDLSASGVRLRTRQQGIRVDQQIRVRLDLPDNGGIFPFVDTSGGQLQPKREWVGWLAVARVRQVGDSFEVAGRLVDMEEMDRGMLSLYLSTRAMAA